MFSDCSAEPVGFPSCWKTNKKNRENASQTSEILTYEAESQTVQPRNAECQTESLLDLMKSTYSLQLNQGADDVSLKRFLISVEPMISKQLKINVAAANLYVGLFKERNRESEYSIICENTLGEESITVNAKSDDYMEVTCVSWSSSGASIAVAYGTNKNLSWSEHKSYVCVWNLDRPKLNERICDQKLELESSTQTIAFHPTHSGYIVAGLFSGMILIWDLANDETIYSTTSHEDPVTCLWWLQSKSSKYMQCLSGSTDGKLITWRCRMGKGATSVRMDKDFQIRATNLSRRSGVRGSGAVGVTCLCPVGLDSGEDITGERSRLLTGSIFAVGCENGSVLKCSIETDDRNPVIFTYDGHVGPVYSIDWSPFHRHLFLTCSTDQTCRVYHSLQSSPLREIRAEEATGGKEINYLFSAIWSPSHPLLFFAVGTRGRIEACDVISSRSLAFSDANGRDGTRCVVDTMQANSQRHDLLATGSREGLTHVWRLGSQLVESNDLSTDMKALNELASEALAAD